VIKKREYEHRVTGLCADNCNNFGGVKMRSENNVYSRLKKVSKKFWAWVVLHIYSCLQTAVDVLTIDTEVLVLKIYKYFHTCTARVTELKSCCDFVSVVYKKLLQHENNRFLSLLPATERILELFQGPKSYFSSQEQCPTVIKKFFENDCGEIYLQSVCGKFHLFNHTIHKTEKTTITATEVAWELKNLSKAWKTGETTNLFPRKLFCCSKNWKKLKTKVESSEVKLLPFMQHA
jgi:hypothetical protein